MTKQNPDRKRGLYQKYEVHRLGDLHGRHDECFFYVLDIDHDKHARVALEAYAESCKAEYPQLSADLMKLLYPLRKSKQ